MNAAPSEPMSSPSGSRPATESRPTLYLDLFSGISGDMFLGALLDLGVDFERLRDALAQLGVRGYQLTFQRQQRQHIEGVKFDVVLDDPPNHQQPEPSTATAHDSHHHHPHSSHHHETNHGEGHSSHTKGHRTYAGIRALIENSALSPRVKTKAVAVFGRIARAEGKLHGRPADEVHFHEVGALDSIVDIVGACVGLEQLGWPRLMAGPVVEGTGWIQCAHGRFPIPSPATLAILGARGIPLTQCEEPHELVTPTGAALLAECVEAFGLMRDLVAERIGYGLGSRENQTRPNVLRAVLGTVAAAPPIHTDGTRDWETDSVVVLETNLDDVPAELLGRFVELALERGALDVFHTPIQMKKSRPGVLLSLLCSAERADDLTELVLRETTAFGVRRYPAERRKLRRQQVSVSTPWGEVVVKLGQLNREVVQTAPEYESCRQVADRAQVPLKQVYEAALRADRPRTSTEPKP